MPADERADVTILAPTALEYWAARVTRPRAVVMRTGIAFQRIPAIADGADVIVCGLAGGLVPGLRPGAVVVPETVSLGGGPPLTCDERLRAALAAAADSIGFRIVTGPLVTADSIVTGHTRRQWADRGFVAADMETGLLSSRECRFACVRVVLDTPERSIADDWLTPGKAMFRPALWGQMAWMAGAAPIYALRAARIAAVAVESLSGKAR